MAARERRGRPRRRTPDDRRENGERATDRRAPRRGAGQTRGARRGRRRTRRVEPAQQNRTEPNARTERTERTNRTHGTEHRTERDGGTTTGVAAGRLAFDGGTWAARGSAPARRSSQDTNARVTSPIKGPAEEARKVRDPGMDAPDADWNSERSRDGSVSHVDMHLSVRIDEDEDDAQAGGPGEEPGGRTCFGCRALCGENRTKNDRPRAERNRTGTARRDPVSSGDPAQGSGRRSQTSAWTRRPQGEHGHERGRPRRRAKGRVTKGTS